MKTTDKPEVKDNINAALVNVVDQQPGLNAIFYLVLALVYAICEVADGINQIVADMPSHDNK